VLRERLRGLSSISLKAQDGWTLMPLRQAAHTEGGSLPEVGTQAGLQAGRQYRVGIHPV